jgi:hypothetical protein
MKPSNCQKKYVTIFCAVSLCFSALTVYANASEEIELCDFKVPGAIARANASFSVIYSIELGPTGKPTKVTKVKNDFLADDPFVNCFRGWQLPPEYGTVSIILNWKHGIGWTQLSISGKGVHRVLKFQPGWCARGVQ